MNVTRFKYFALLLSLLSFLNIVNSQSILADSLLNQLKNESDEKARSLLYGQLARAYIQINYDSALNFGNKGLYLAKKIEFCQGINNSYIALGHIKVVQNELFQAMDYYEKAANAAKTCSDKNGIAVAYLLLGNVYYTLSNYPEALKYYQKGMVIADSINKVEILPDFYNNLAALNARMGKYNEAINSYNKGLEIKEDANDLKGKAFLYQNIAGIYVDIKNYDTAAYFLDKAYKIYNELKNNEGLMYVTNVYASIEQKRGKYKNAIEYYKKLHQDILNLGSDYYGPTSYLKANYFTNIGVCYLKVKNFKDAESNLLAAYKIAHETGQLEYIKLSAQYLSELYEIYNRPVDALKYAKLFKIYSDSLSTDENVKKITQLEMQFSFDKKMKEQEIELAKKEAIQKRKELIYFMAFAGTLLALIILFLLFRLQKIKVNKVNLEKKTLLADLDYKNKELTTNVMYLLEKNEFILNISDKLKKSRYDFKPDNRKIVDDIIRELETSSSKDIWKDFEVRFQEVHADFYDKLTQQFPDLSPNELKLCAFLRLNMTTKEIASITYQSVKSINIARYRLRKEMGIGSYANLVICFGKI